jgi:hypothetical protein
MVGFDFLWHAGALAAIYKQSSPFLLSPELSFRLIPLGYLSFLLLAILIVWLIQAFQVITLGKGFIFGLKIGALIWGALTLGLLSVSTAPIILLGGWFFGQTVELAIAGAVAAEGSSNQRFRPLIFGVVIFDLLCFVLAIVLQNLSG